MGNVSSNKKTFLEEVSVAIRTKREESKSNKNKTLITKVWFVKENYWNDAALSKVVLSLTHGLHRN